MKKSQLKKLIRETINEQFGNVPYTCMLPCAGLSQPGGFGNVTDSGPTSQLTIGGSTWGMDIIYDCSGTPFDLNSVGNVMQTISWAMDTPQSYNWCEGGMGSAPQTVNAPTGIPAISLVNALLDPSYTGMDFSCCNMNAWPAAWSMVEGGFPYDSYPNIPYPNIPGPGVDSDDESPIKNPDLDPNMQGTQILDKFGNMVSVAGSYTPPAPTGGCADPNAANYSGENIDCGGNEVAGIQTGFLGWNWSSNNDELGDTSCCDYGGEEIDMSNENNWPEGCGCQHPDAYNFCEDCDQSCPEVTTGFLGINWSQNNDCGPAAQINTGLFGWNWSQNNDDFGNTDCCNFGAQGMPSAPDKKAKKPARPTTRRTARPAARPAARKRR
jgi:hypothetical protein